MPEQERVAACKAFRGRAAGKEEPSGVNRADEEGKQRGNKGKGEKESEKRTRRKEEGREHQREEGGRKRRARRGGGGQVSRNTNRSKLPGDNRF